MPAVPPPPHRRAPAVPLPGGVVFLTYSTKAPHFRRRDTQAGVVDGRYDLQYYIDFCRNKGMFATGATNIEVFFKDGTTITNNVIPLMPNMDSYGPFISMFAPSPNRRHAAQPSRAGDTRSAS